MTARQLAVAAWAVFPTSQAAAALTTLLAEKRQNMLPAGALPHADSGPKGGVLWVTHTPGGQLLTQPAGPPIRAGAPNGVTVVPFGPHGKLLISADADGTVIFWQVSLSADPYTALCAFVGPPTRQEWNRYAPGEPQPKACR